MFYTDDPLADFLRHDDEEIRWVNSRPVCSECGEHIVDETAYYIDCKWICQGCMENHEKYIEDFDD